MRNAFIDFEITINNVQIAYINARIAYLKRQKR
jgi:hypothetical protein